MLIGLVVPVYGYFVQLSGVAMTLHLYNTRTVDVLAEVAVYSPIPILIMFSFYQRVPREMIEAAKVDGAMEFALFTRVVLPLARPAVVLCLVFGFVWIWSDLFLPSVLLVSQSKYPIPAGISFIIGVSTQVPPVCLALRGDNNVHNTDDPGLRVYEPARRGRDNWRSGPRLIFTLSEISPVHSGTLGPTAAPSCTPIGTS